MNSVLWIICLAGYGMMVGDLLRVRLKDYHPVEAEAKPSTVPYPMPIRRKNPWS